MQFISEMTGNIIENIENVAYLMKKFLVCTKIKCSLLTNILSRLPINSEGPHLLVELYVSISRSSIQECLSTYVFIE